jgi:hypothetical protein
MSEYEEIRLRESQQRWRAQQDAAGGLVFLLGILAVGSLVLFIFTLERQTAALMVSFLMLLLLACARLVWSAAQVVSISNTLEDARRQTELVDVEIISPPPPWTHPRLLRDRWG